MLALYYIILFLFGIAIGSFLNVLVLRMNTGMTIGGRSQCFSCGKKLSFKELIPVFSFLFQKGRCRGCSSKISIQYMLVELATAILFVAVGYKFADYSLYNFANVAYLILGLIMVSVFVAIFVYDLRHKIIPDSFVVALSIVGLLLISVSVYSGLVEPIQFAIQTVSGLILFAPFYLLWLISSGKWIGLGDGKLALAFGILLPFSSAISGIVIAFWIGAIFGVALIVISRSKKVTLKSEVPFAPFLIVGVLISYFFTIDIFHINFLIEYAKYFL